MEALILAGGLGTRLNDLTKNTPKPMVEVAGSPFLKYIFDELVYYGFDHVVLAVSYLKEQIINYFHSEYKSIKIDYAFEDVPLGTGGAILNAFDLLKEENFFVINGDTMSKVDYKEMSKDNHLSIAIKLMHNFDRYGEVKINNNIITSFEEKRLVDSGYINTGVYYLNKQSLLKYKPESPKFSLEKEIFENHIKELQLKAYISDDYFIDIGIPEDYQRAQKELKKEKALFLDRDGIVNIDKGHVYKISDFEFTPYVFDIIKKFPDYKIVIVTNQAGIAKGLYGVKDYEILNEYMIAKFKEKGVNISGTYYCPHKDEDNCDCRKPKPGLFLKAAHDLNIDLENSVAIGDKMSDLIAAHNAGIKTLYFVKTIYEEKPVNFEYMIWEHD